MNAQTLTESLPRKEREKRARQQDIMKAARDLFAAKGFRDTTLDEIAHHAEFGKGTLYNYFSSKEDIFHAIVDEAIEDTLSLARETLTTPGDLRERLEQYVLRMVRYMGSQGELFHAIFQELYQGRSVDATRMAEIIRRANEVVVILAELFQKEMNTGSIRQADPRQYAFLLNGMIRGVSSKQALLDGRTPSEEETARVARLVVSVFLEGITERTSKG